MILSPQSLPPVSSVIPFTPLIQADHGPHEPAERVIHNEQEYYAFWGGSPPSQPDVDFSKEVVVAVAVGERPTGGYQVAITGITRINIGIMGGTYWISYVETPPSGAAPRVLTYPCHVVKCEPLGGRVFFTKDTTPQQPMIVEGRASGVSFEDAFQDAMRKAPAANLNRYTLIAFWVESGGFTGTTTSVVTLEYHGEG